MNFTQQLFSLPEIIFNGVEHSLVVSMLTEQQRQQITRLPSEEEKLALACQFGDQSDRVRDLYRCLIDDPAERARRGYPYPTFANIENSFWFIFLSTAQRDVVKRLDSEKQKQIAVLTVVGGSAKGLPRFCGSPSRLPG
jgi:hypothetical protein